MKGRNYSRKREAILEKIRSTTCHPTAEWVFQELKEEYPDLSLGTVYRNLVLFKEDKTILSIGAVDGQERFDAHVQPHGHFICKQCNDISDVDLPESDLIAYTKQMKNCKVERLDLTVYGTCAACLEVEQLL